MKPLKITISACLLLSFFQAKGQGFYFETNSSYNLPLGSQEIGQNSSDNTTYNYISGNFGSSSTTEQVRGSYGKGLQLGLGVGYMFNSIIGFEVKAEQQSPTSYELKSTSTYTNIDFSGTSSSYASYTLTFKSSMTKITPSIIFQLPGERIKPYAQFGAILGFGKVDGSYEYIDNSDITKGKFVMNGGMAVGVNGEFGVNYPFTEKLSLNAGITFSGLSYAPLKGELTEYSENGINMLPGLTVNERETEFSDETTYNSNTTADPNKPSQEMKMWFPYSNVGLNIGIKFSL